ncbi:hypothetical protein E8E14_001885 [Neopestalotiopsis sp. 37M]|nr:hypothetical protein E8E14_001885 [Neopestalotiopsis sp. 37M]
MRLPIYSRIPSKSSTKSLKSDTPASKSEFLTMASEATPSNTGADKFPPITRGFEFEFMLPYRWDKMEGYDDIVVDKGKTYTIRDGCIILPRPQYHKSEHDPDYDAFNNRLPGSHHHPVLGPPTVEPSHPSAKLAGHPHYYRWNIKSDASMSQTWPGTWFRERGPYELLDVELISPPLLDNDPAADKQIEMVLEVIRNTFLYFTPHSCGFHVHIGQGNVLFDAESAKGVAAMCFCIEHLFNTLHVEHRRWDAHGNHPSIRYWSNAGAGMTAAEANKLEMKVDKWRDNYVDKAFQRVPHVALKQGVEAILGTTSVEAVKRLMTAPERPVYNFDNLQTDTKPTVECRQCAGTLNTEWVLHWSHIMAAVVDLGRRANGTLFWPQLVRSLALVSEMGEIPDGAMTIDKFVRDVLKLPEAADYIASTTPHTRCYPLLSEKQKRMRENPAIARQIGRIILP